MENGLVGLAESYLQDLPLIGVLLYMLRVTVQKCENIVMEDRSIFLSMLKAELDKEDKKHDNN